MCDTQKGAWRISLVDMLLRLADTPPIPRPEPNPFKPYSRVLARNGNVALDVEVVPCTGIHGNL